jgi:hypothetical protein
VGVTVTVPAETGAAGRPSRFEVIVLLYALSGGVLWWALHLAVLAAVTPAVCGGWPAWIFTAVNVVCAAGVVTALYASVVLRRLAPPAAAVTGRNRFLGVIAIIVNVASLALVVLESVPTYVLDACR